MTCCADSRCGVTRSSGAKTWVIATRPAVLLLLFALSALGQDARALQFFDHRRGEIG